ASVELTAAAEELAHAVRRRAGMFRDCYEDSLKNHDALAGKVVMSLDIGKSGRVLGVAFTKDTLKNRTVERCIRRRAMAWRFDKPSDGTVRVQATLAFDTPHKPN